MQSKNFLLSKAVILKNLTRFWPVWTVELVILFFLNMSNISQIQETKKAMEEATKNYYYDGGFDVSNWIEPVGILTIVFSILTVGLVFGYLGDKKEAYLVHSFPIKRKTLFWSHYVSGLLMIFVPVVLFSILYFCELPSGSHKMGSCLVLFLQVVVGILACYHLACVSCLLTANRISGAVIYGVLNIFVYALGFCMSFIMEFMVYGFQGEFWDDGLESVLSMFLTSLTPGAFWSYTLVDAQLGEKGRVISYICKTQVFGIFWILLPTVLFLVAAYYLYKKRAIETAGDMIAFSWAKPVYKVVFTFFFSNLFAIAIPFLADRGWGEEYQHRIFFLLMLILGAILGYLVVTMILERTFFIWKKVKWYQILLPGLSMLVLCYLGKGFVEMSGMVLPKIGNISMISVDSGYEEEEYEWNSLYFTEQEEVEKLVELTKQCMDEHKKLPPSSLQEHYSLSFYLNDGQQVYRSFQVKKESNSMKQIREFCMEKNLIPRFFVGEISDITITQNENYNEEEEFWEDEQELWYERKNSSGFSKAADDLMTAIKEDEKAGNLIMRNFQAKEWKEANYRLRIGILIPQVLSDGADKGETAELSQSVSLWVSEKNVNTIQFIKSLVEEQSEKTTQMEKSSK